MRRIITLAIIILATATALHARKITGKVHHNKKGLPGVVVSDGIKFTHTNPDGTFTIDTHKYATWVQFHIKDPYGIDSNPAIELAY